MCFLHKQSWVLFRAFVDWRRPTYTTGDSPLHSKPTKLILTSLKVNPKHAAHRSILNTWHASGHPAFQPIWCMKLTITKCKVTNTYMCTYVTCLYMKARKAYKKNKVIINTESRMEVIWFEGSRKAVRERHYDLSSTLVSDSMLHILK